MRRLLLLAVGVLFLHEARAATLSVGPGKTYAKPCLAIAAAQAGDIIEVDSAGDYAGDTCAWATDNLTVRGVGGRAKIDLTGVPPAQKKGIFTITAPNATIENFELSNAAISAADGNNGAGIRHQGQNLIVRGCFFHDNQDGILGAPPVDGQGTILIETSEFANNGAGDGFSHNMYLNHYASFTLRYSYSHGAKVGHLVKTRAQQNFILYNRITDETGTTASYEIDVPNGGTTFILGNLIEQADTTQNPSIVSYAEEGAINPDQHFYFVNNTVVNDHTSGTFLNLAGGTTALVQNDIFKGPGNLPSSGAGITLANNWTDAQGDPLLVSVATYDYHLQAGSPCVDKGADPGTGSNQALAPDHQYVHPANSEGRIVAGSSIDIGAYELGGGVDAGSDGNVVEGGVDAGADGGGGGPPSGGCGCRTTSGTPRTGGFALVVMALALLRRRRSR